jgi:cytochrome c oxidase cbb3-type subunit 2
MNHGIFEKNSIILLVGILIVVSIGGLVQIAPLYWVDSTIEKVNVDRRAILTPFRG